MEMHFNLYFWKKINGFLSKVCFGIKASMLERPMSVSQVKPLAPSMCVCVCVCF